MGIFNWVKRKIYNNNVKETYVSKYSDNDSYPDIEKYPNAINVGFNGMQERFNDKYDTGTPYSLRELLVLIWWLHLKKGRNSDAKLPQYFITTYSESPSQITNKFFSDGLLYVDDKNIVRGTDVGNILNTKFSDLWEIHSKTYAVLDDVFDKWDFNKYQLSRNEQVIKYLTARDKYIKDVAAWEKRHHENYSDDLRSIEMNIKEIEQLQRQNEAIRMELQSK